LLRSRILPPHRPDLEDCLGQGDVVFTLDGSCPPGYSVVIIYHLQLHFSFSERGWLQFWLGAKEER
jgi:hypothetical protein